MDKLSAFEYRINTTNNFQNWRLRKHEATYALMGFCIANFLVGVIMIFSGLYEQRDEATLMTFARLPPPAGEKSSHMLDKRTLFDYRKIAVTSLGALAVIKGTIGFSVALLHGTFMLATYSTVLSLIVLGQVVALSTGFSYRRRVDSNLATQLELTIHDAYEGAIINKNRRILQSHEPFSVAWDLIMTRYQCCGVKSHKDFGNNSTLWNRALLFRGGIVRAHVPLVCCKMDNPGDFPRDTRNLQFVNLGKCMKHGDVRYINTTPCLESIRSVIYGYTNVYAVILVINTFLDVNCVALAIYIIVLIRGRNFRRHVFRDRKRELFTMIQDIAIGMLNVDSMPPASMSDMHGVQRSLSDIERTSAETVAQRWRSRARSSNTDDLSTQSAAQRWKGRKGGGGRSPPKSRQ